MIFDLHIHTTGSDGLLTPKEVIDAASNKSIHGVAITDHDTVSGIKPAINYSKIKNVIQVIPGIEFSSIFSGEEVHILGYFIDYESKRLLEIIEELKNNRIIRALKIIEKLNKLGIELNLEEVNILSKTIIGRPHIARALVNRGHVDSIKEAFDLLLNRGMPAYVEKESLKLKETIDIIHELQGIAVLAHPGLLKNKGIIKQSIEYGIDGLESIHSKHSRQDVIMLMNICKDNGLITTGGSDCHGNIIDGEYLLGKYYININDIPIMKGRL